MVFCRNVLLHMQKMKILYENIAQEKSDFKNPFLLHDFAVFPLFWYKIFCNESAHKCYLIHY